MTYFTTTAGQNRVVHSLQVTDVLVSFESVLLSLFRVSTGVYGAFSMCNSTQQLGYALNQYYISQGNSQYACDWNGQAQIIKPAATAASCSAKLASASASNSFASTATASASLPSPTRNRGESSSFKRKKRRPQRRRVNPPRVKRR